eukprot:CAMPEP_0198284478 /NCGR_PEP_ID=MMETSP1449-20131203/3945_1 /TAXON_ID=420275 /ORGANISM="Attheya septentrionalis, Strain CCMP2084" /LENGTH=459 /DNA_ID=CAMNT_0043981567 /DNA_START=151 /DNA_END=1533 /DNA_ORIENTATION=+
MMVVHLLSILSLMSTITQAVEDVDAQTPWYFLKSETSGTVENAPLGSSPQRLRSSSATRGKSSHELSSIMKLDERQRDDPDEIMGFARLLQMSTTSSPTQSPTKRSPAPTNPPPSPTAPPTLPAPTNLPTQSPTNPPTFPPPTFSPTPSPTAPPTNSCGITDDERKEEIRKEVETVSDPVSVGTPGMPQNSAYEWLVNEDTLFICPTDPTVIQRYVMAVFYFSTEGSRWRECKAPNDFNSPAEIELANEACNITSEYGDDPKSNAWLTPESECAWGGTSCNTGTTMDSIDFQDNIIAGLLPSELGQLTGLENLALEEGLISGTIPSQLGSLQLLEILDLNINSMSGTIPASLYTLENLIEFDIDTNDFSGSISSAIGQMTNLRFVQFFNNKFTSTLPDTLGELAALEVLSVEFNQLSGSMPASVCELVTENPTTKVSADCIFREESPPYVECDCCIFCR